ncbi:MAG: family 43 glycosylhydrolase [Clostridia bacterium]|nr:family 43 glycosylhydrolase [Clostridia bacterium]
MTDSREAPGPRRGNPLRPGNTPDNMFPDPHIKIFVNPDTGRENMYVYVGHDEGRGQFIMRDWYVLFSEDLVHWQCKKSLDRRDTYLPPDSTDCWACDAVRSPWDGRYYLYYSHGGESTGVAVSDRPDGPFTDARGKTPILPKGITPTNSYDPDIILPDGEDSRAWILFGSDWTDHYWAMQLRENMVEVVPGSARKVPVWPDADTHEELLGPLRSDQAEAFRCGDRWYLYWAGRYATSDQRLGPYIFRGNIGADIPHYPDGRAFIDHGSFTEWKGQWFYAVSCGEESWSFRQTWLMYLHVCDDGTLMFDEEIRQYGVGQYWAGWEKIHAAWYMEIDAPALRKIELREEDGTHRGFAVAQETGTHCARYPHVYGLQENMTLTLSLRGEAGAGVTVLCDGQEAGSLCLAAETPAFTPVTLPLRNPPGEHEITLRLTGRMAVAWFRFRDGSN